MKSPINIVLLTPGFAADEKDTTAIPALQLYTRFIKSHFEDISLRIVAFQYPFKAGHYTWNGIPVYSAGRSRFKWTRILTWIKVLCYLRKLHKKEGIDIVHSFWLTEATLTGLVFSWLTGVKFLATSMGQDVKPGNKYLRILRHFSFKLTVISKFQHSFKSNLGKADVLKVIPFGIDKTYFYDIPLNRTIDILGVGSLNSVKNYPEFIGVIETVVRTFPGIRCRIIGEGSKRTEIEKIIREKGLENAIVLAGSVSYETTIGEMQEAKILLHTSTFEGQALVIMEALAAGLYVVSHPVGIAASLQSDKLLTGATSQELASHILEILKKPALDYRSEVHYSIDDTCREYFEIYQELLK